MVIISSNYRQGFEIAQAYLSSRHPQLFGFLSKIFVWNKYEIKICELFFLFLKWRICLHAP